MKDLIEYIAKSLVDHPELIQTTETVHTDGTTIVVLYVDESDMGKVIGKKGRIAKSIRSIIKAISTKDNKNIILEITNLE